MNKLIERFAEIQGISYEEAEKQIGAETDEEILANIQAVTTQMIIQKSQVKLNRAQRRALAKKTHNPTMKNQNAIDAIADTTTKLNYIDLIQKLRKLNEKKEKEENDAAN